MKFIAAAFLISSIALSPAVFAWVGTESIQWLENTESIPLIDFQPPRDTLLMETIMYPDSQPRHFYFAVPSSFPPEGEAPLFIYLHGGVSTTDLRTLEPEILHEWCPIPRLLEEGYLVAFPCGQMGSAWWDPVGEEGILRILRWMKLNFPVDDSRVFVGGFSDGASGSFSLMMLHPSDFAGYLAFSGHPGVAELDGGRSTYFPSLSNRPGIVSHSDLDGLYPSGLMAPAVALAESAGARIEYYEIQGYEHDAAYLPLIEDEIFAFLNRTSREPFPPRIVWEAGEPSACDWLAVDSIVPWPLIGEDRDYNMILVSERLQFGFYPDWEYEGDGVLVSGVVDGDIPAARLGLQKGDIITGFQGSDVLSLDDIGELQSGMAPGDSFSITLDRGGERLSLRDSFNPPEYYWLFPRQGVSVRIRAEYEDNVFRLSSSRLCRLRILLHPEMVDLSDEITVICNGYTVFKGMVEEDANYAEECFRSNLDGDRIYVNEIMLDLEELLPPLIREAGGVIPATP